MIEQLFTWVLFVWILYLWIEISEIKLKVEGQWDAKKVHEHFVLKIFGVVFLFILYLTLSFILSIMIVSSFTSLGGQVAFVIFGIMLTFGIVWLVFSTVRLQRKRDEELKKIQAT